MSRYSDSQFFQLINPDRIIEPVAVLTLFGSPALIRTRAPSHDTLRPSGSAEKLKFIVVSDSSTLKVEAFQEAHSNQTLTADLSCEGFFYALRRTVQIRFIRVSGIGSKSTFSTPLTGQTFINFS